ncbi:WG repeat protein [Elizabethkingia sp. YR214]|uniref:WG repeat-containing protein n=1 Tax=Elizabethkingia sp. YR214 TaxID=2135667 RepID=UPI000D2F7BD7|nr:WG repeat-containing protein [Elizabethkingia sp. YR214]PUB25906.1 WG repeat protein [Elizabethkingia sp. YR214]
MKYALFLITGIVLLTGCQRKKDVEALYYFPNADTTYVGVKDGRGNMIIPAIHPALNSSDIDEFYFGKSSGKHTSRIFYHNKDSLIPEARYDFEKPITGPVIQFFGLSKGSTADREGQRIPAGEVYSREGKLLYYIAGYTARQYTGYYFVTPQAFSEGYRLYVENGKLGYVDGLGNKLTSAQWEFAEPFNYGYAKVYIGRWEQVAIPGFVDYRALTDTAHTGYINLKGEIVKPYKVARSKKDYRLAEGGYLPYPFVYTATGQKIVDSLNNIEALSYTHLTEALYAEVEQKKLHFEITLCPQTGFPYYYVQGYRKTLGNTNYTFLVDKDTWEMYQCSPDFFLTGKKIPFARWIANSLQETNDRWSEEMPGVKLKMDINKEIRYWQGKAALKK